MQFTITYALNRDEVFTYDTTARSVLDAFMKLQAELRIEHQSSIDDLIGFSILKREEVKDDTTTQH